MCPFVSRAVVVERWVRFCRSPRWSFRTLIYVALRLAGEPGHTGYTSHLCACRPAAAAPGPAPPGRAAREARPRRNPDTLATRTRDGGLVPVRFSCLIGHIGLALRWACGRGPRRRFCNCILVTSAARSFARMPPARARRLVHVHVELEADAKVVGFGCHRVGSGALP